MLASPWAVLVAAVVVQAATAPGQTVGVSVFVDHLVADLGMARSTLATAYLIGTLTGAVAMAWAGRFIDRRGPRRAVALFGVAFGLVLAGMAGVTGFATLVVGFVGIRALGQGALTLTASTAVAIGFERRRGTAIGMKSAAGSALMSLVPLAATVLIATVGWRWAWIALAVGVWAVLAPVAASPVLARRPLPDSERVDVEARSARRGATVRQALATRAYWVVLVAVGLNALVATALAFHHIDLLGEGGLGSTAAAANFLPQTLAGAAAALLAGRLADRVREGALLACTMVTLAAAPLLVVHVRPGLVALGYGLVLGAATSSIRSVEATLLPRWFGTDHIGEIRGVVMAVTVASSAAGPLALAAAVDRFGSYAPALHLFAAAATLLAVVGATVRPPAAAAGPPRRPPPGDCPRPATTVLTSREGRV